jgi:hypothetical protein
VKADSRFGLNSSPRSGVMPSLPVKYFPDVRSTKKPTRADNAGFPGFPRPRARLARGTAAFVVGWEEELEELDLTKISFDAVP